jgi:sec-independent protein translocase protein TatB
VPGIQELLVILVVALLVFGPDRLPDLARAIGRGVRTVRRFTSTAAAELRSVSELTELEREILALRRELDGASERLRRDIDLSPLEVRREAERLLSEGTPPPADPEAT